MTPVARFSWALALAGSCAYANSAALKGPPGAPAAQTPAAKSPALQLKRVTLSSAGVGYFEYEATVTGDAALQLTVKLADVDDVLKSLVVFDDQGTVGGLSLPGREPLAQLLRALPFAQDALNSQLSLLTALRGAQVQVVTGKGVLVGRIVSVEPFKRAPLGGQATPTEAHRLSLMTQQGLQSVVLEDAQSLQFTDATLRAQIELALQGMASERAGDTRTIDIVSKGAGTRLVRVGYVGVVPIWKMSYRLTLPSDVASAAGNDQARPPASAQLQGWAVVENLGAVDWRNVTLTLTSGRPVAFRQSLYESYFNERPKVAVQLPTRIVPNADGGLTGGVRRESSDAESLEQSNFAVRAAMAPPAPSSAAPRPAAAPAPMMRMASPAPASKSREANAAAGASDWAQASDVAVLTDTGTQVSFRFSEPVNVAAGRSFAVPIVSARVPTQRIAQWQPQVGGQTPLAAVELRNSSAVTWPAGAVTVLESGAGGGAFLGDAQLTALPAGDSRTLPFASEQRMAVVQSQQRADDVRRVRLEGAVLISQSVVTLTQQFTVRSSADTAQALYAEAAKYAQFTLIDPPKGGNVTIQGEAGNNYRLSLAVQPRRDNRFALVQERPVESRQELASVGLATLKALQRLAVDDASRTKLTQLIALNEVLLVAQLGEATAQQRVDRLRQDQERVRENLRAVEPGSALHKRYSASLAKSESDMEAALTLRDTQALARSQATENRDAFFAAL